MTRLSDIATTNEQYIYCRETLGRAIEAHAVDLSDAQVDACARDLTDMWDAGEWALLEDVIEEWLHRIGGWRNVPAYADTQVTRLSQECRRV